VPVKDQGHGQKPGGVDRIDTCCCRFNWHGPA
jgi:hypothetical protein